MDHVFCFEDWTEHGRPDQNSMEDLHQVNSPNETFFAVTVWDSLRYASAGSKEIAICAEKLHILS